MLQCIRNLLVCLLARGGPTTLQHTFKEYIRKKSSFAGLKHSHLKRNVLVRIQGHREMDSQSITLSIGCAAAMGEDLLGEKMETTGGRHFSR